MYEIIILPFRKEKEALIPRVLYTRHIPAERIPTIYMQCFKKHSNFQSLQEALIYIQSFKTRNLG